MTRFAHWTALSLALILTAACGSSPPINYYVLSAQESTLPSGLSPSVGVGPIRIPEYLARENIVSSRDGNALDIARTDRWAEPLESGIQRALAVNLTGLLDTQAVLLFPWRQELKPEYGVSINLLELDVQAGQATLAVDWIVYHPGEKTVVERRLSRLNQPLAGTETDTGSLAKAYSDLLLELSEIIAASIRADAAKSG